MSLNLGLPEVNKSYIASSDMHSNDVGGKCPTGIFEIENIQVIKRWNGSYYNITTREGDYFSVRYSVWEKYFIERHPDEVRSGWYLTRKYDVKAFRTNHASLYRSLPDSAIFVPFWIEVYYSIASGHKIIVHSSTSNGMPIDISATTFRRYFMAVENTPDAIPESEFYKFEHREPKTKLEEGSFFATRFDVKSGKDISRETLGQPFFVKRIYRNPEFNEVVVKVQWKPKYEVGYSWQYSTFRIHVNDLNNFVKVDATPCQVIQPAADLMRERCERRFRLEWIEHAVAMNKLGKVKSNEPLSFTVENEAQRVNAIKILQNLRF